MIYQKNPIDEFENPQTAKTALYVRFDDDTEVPLIFSESRNLSIEFQLTEDPKHTHMVFTDPNTGKRVALTLRRYNG